jgi:hypothetical protein
MPYAGAHQPLLQPGHIGTLGPRPGSRFAAFFQRFPQLAPGCAIQGSAGSLRYVNLFRRPDQYHASSLDLDSHLHAPLLGEERAKGSVTCDAGRPVFFVTQPALPRAA